MKKWPKKRSVFLPFDEALQVACNGHIVSGAEYEGYIAAFAAKHRDDLKKLYLKHGVPLREILEDVGLCKFAPLPATAAPLIRERALQLKSAAMADQVAKDLEEWNAHRGPLHGVPELGTRTKRINALYAFWCVGELYQHRPIGLRLTELSRGLRDYADAIRHVKVSAKHRPRDVMFAERALNLTYTFLRYASRPLWDYTARLIITDRRVANGQDSVKKAVRAALKRNPNGFLERRIARALQRQHRGTHALPDRRRQSRRQTQNS